MLLGNFADITTGLVLSRKKSKITDNKNIYKSLTLKSFEEDGYIDLKEVDEFESNEELNEQYLTKEGDIVIRLTTPFTSLVINKKFEGFVIPSNFAVIRIKENKFIPGYVSLILNSDKLRKQFNRSSIGTAIPIIKVTALKDINIKEHSLELQEKLFKLNQLFLEEKNLLKSLIIEKEIRHKAILKKLLDK